MSSHRRRLAGVLATALVAAATTVLVGATTAPASAADCPGAGDGTTCSQTFLASPETVTFTVPAGVRRMRARVVGGSGSSSDSFARAAGGGFNGVGGSGGRITADFPVVPGSTLSILVGRSDGNGWRGAGGGSYVFGPAGTPSPVVIVAGGGGEAANADRRTEGPDGGAGGGAQTSAPATAGSNLAGGGAGGETRGGSSSGEGDTFGKGPARLVGGSVLPGAGGSADTGSAMDGGDGGSGWFGGGAGGSGDNPSGGGGGSGHVSDAVTVIDSQAGSNVGDGRVVLTWTPAPAGPSVTTTTLPDATFGAAYSQTLTATGGTAPYSWAVTAGALPAGLTLSSAGVVSGTPTAATASGTPAASTVRVQDANGAGSTADLAVAVAKATQTVSFVTAPPTTPRVGTTYDATTTSTGSPSAVVLSSTGRGCSTSGTTVSFVHADACAVSATKPGSDDYAEARASFTPTIQKGEQVVTFRTTATDPVVGGTYRPRADGGAADTPVTYAVPETTDTVCRVATNEGTPTVTFLAVGTCTIIARQAGDADHDPGMVRQDVVVGKAPQTITFTSTPPSPARITTSYTPTATGGSSGNRVSFSVQTTPDDPCLLLTEIDGDTGEPLSSTIVFNHAGTCVVTADQAGNGQYAAAPQVTQSITVAKDPQAVSITSAAPTTATVGGPTYVVTTSGSETGNPVSVVLDESTTDGACTVSGTTVSFVHAGTCAVAATQAAGPDHTAARSAVQSFAVRDTTVPSTRAVPRITATLSSARPVTSFGWYSEPVTVTFACTSVPGAAAVVSCPAPVRIGRNSTGRTVTGTVTAADGATARATVGPVNLDKTAPRVRLVQRAGRAPRCRATDARSGVASCTVTRAQTRRGSVLVVKALDKAGNRAVRRVRLGR